MFKTSHRMSRSSRLAQVVVATVFAAAVAGPSHAAEKLKIGTLTTTGTGPLYIGKDKGYFAAEGFDIDIVPFDAGQPVAVAAVSGDIDFGIAGVTSALYTMAGQGALRLIGGWAYDAPTFHTSGIIASK